MVKIVLSSAWSQGGRTEFEGDAGSLHEVIRAFAAGNPAYRRRLLNADGEPLTYFNVYLDDVLVPRQDRATTEVEDHTTVTIVPPLAGG
ncbi:hypothetical protein GCM10029978_055450 [Actinoallomurus acanthiterrae]|jgi:molybdopterin synthase sulfur carrier subunit